MTKLVIIDFLEFDLSDH